MERQKEKFGFALKSPLGHNKQIKTAKALIIQQYTRQRLEKRRAQRAVRCEWRWLPEKGCSVELNIKTIVRGENNFTLLSAAHIHPTIRTEIIGFACIGLLYN